MLTLTAVRSAEILDQLHIRRMHILADSSIDIYAIYCTATGSKLGLISDDALSLLPHANMSDSELLLQCLVAARPGPGWVIKRKDSYAHFFDFDPNGLLIHLLGLVFDPLESHHKKSYGLGVGPHATRWKTTAARVEFLERKIRLRQRVDSMPALQRNSFLHQLLELDARKGLQHARPSRAMTWERLAANAGEEIGVLLSLLSIQWRAEIAKERSNDSKAGAYFSRQATGLLVNPDKPKHTKVARAEQDNKDLLQAFLDIEAAETIEEVKENREVMATISTALTPEEAARRAQEFEREHAKPAIKSLGEIKI